MAEQKKTDPVTGCCIGCFSLMAAIVFLVVVCSMFAKSTPEDRAHSDKIEAWTRAQVFVKRRLKAPGSASFGSAFSEYQDPDNTVTILGNDKFLVSGWVDAQNGFGALIRTHFTCTIERSADGESWKLLDIAFTQQ